MYRKRYNVMLTILLIIIIIAVIGLLSFIGYKYYTEQKLNKEGKEFADSFEEEMISSETPTEGPAGTGENNGNQGDNEDLQNTVEDITTTNSSTGNTSTTGTKRKTYKGFEVLGTIKISKTNISYPILSKVTKKSLETSVAVVYPENIELNNPGNVVIVGHNYRNSTFFSNNKKLSKGDKIDITDEHGKKVTYVIYKIFQTSDTDTSFYNRNTNGKREITLSTCTDDAKERLIIQAAEE